MKKIFFIYTMVLFAACSKRTELSPLNSFNVTTEKASYSIRDTVNFVLNGEPENIVFWSGEEGNNYEYRNRTSLGGSNKVELNFKSFSQSGTADRTNIKLMVSTDFSGTVDAANIQKANWVDISGRATWSTGTDNTQSGNVNLDDFANQNKLITFAFWHKTTVLKPLSQQNRWVIRSFDVTSKGTSLSMSNAAWTRCRFDGATSGWQVSATQLITGRSETELYDDWCVSKLFNPNKVDTDKGTPIKDISAKKLTSYSKLYSKPGVYKVAFVATNGNVEKQQSVVKEITLNITP